MESPAPATNAVNTCGKRDFQMIFVQLAGASPVPVRMSQTAGRGRLGRNFYSPSDTGVYMSLLLRPAALKPEQAVKITMGTIISTA